MQSSQNLAPNKLINTLLSMNKKKNPGDILTKRTTMRYKSSEYQKVKIKASEAGLSFSDFCRQMTLEGYVQAVHTPHNINETRMLKVLLLEYRTHFARISNMIRYSDPALNSEITELKNSIQAVIEKISL